MYVSFMLAVEVPPEISKLSIFMDLTVVIITASLFLNCILAIYTSSIVLVFPPCFLSGCVFKDAIFPCRCCFVVSVASLIFLSDVLNSNLPKGPKMEISPWLCSCIFTCVC